MFNSVFLFCVNNQSSLREHQKLSKGHQVTVIYWAAISIFLQPRRANMLRRLEEAEMFLLGQWEPLVRQCILSPWEGELSLGKGISCPFLAHFLRRLTGLDPTLANFFSLTPLHTDCSRNVWSDLAVNRLQPQRNWNHFVVLLGDISAALVALHSYKCICACGLWALGWLSAKAHCSWTNEVLYSGFSLCSRA